ncbi:hypothetical protein RS030_6778 [Cryptosporidium xiaoi]|uniref:Uncharacterized protein n=1 Tax=Cryptosporidium xiaoi TaxID=659607 RepID=A0AAV9Y0N3_9CRYT
MYSRSFSNNITREYVLFHIDGIPEDIINHDLLEALINSSIISILGNIGSIPLKYNIIYVSSKLNNAIIVTDTKYSCYLRFCLSMTSSWDKYNNIRFHTLRTGSTLSTLLKNYCYTKNKSLESC